MRHTLGICPPVCPLPGLSHLSPTAPVPSFSPLLLASQPPSLSSAEQVRPFQASVSRFAHPHPLLSTAASMSKAINTKDECFICASQTKDAPVIRTALLRGWRGLKMTFFLSYHMFIFKIKSLLYALKRAQALSFSLFLKTSCLFVSSL